MHNKHHNLLIIHLFQLSAQPSANTNFAYHSANGGDTPSISVNQTNIVTGATGAGAMLTPVSYSVLLLL